MKRVIEKVLRFVLKDKTAAVRKIKLHDYAFREWFWNWFYRKQREDIKALQEKLAEKIKAEEDAAWEEYRQQKRAEEEKRWEEELCPCGHKHADHYLDDCHCQFPGCDCPQFGEPVENWETYTEVIFGDPPGGFQAYE